MIISLLYHNAIIIVVGIGISMWNRSGSELQEGLCQHVVSFKFSDECCAMNLQKTGSIFQIISTGLENLFYKIPLKVFPKSSDKLHRQRIGAGLNKWEPVAAGR